LVYKIAKSVKWSITFFQFPIGQFTELAGLAECIKA
jgi:hypothetical protein